jgi:hypothetical protein
MFKKMFKKENLVKLEIQESGNVVLSKALTKLADDFLEGMTKCKDKEIMSNLSCTREKLVNLAQYAGSNTKKHFECEKESLDLIIESLKEYKESISTTIKKGSTNIDFDLLCGEVHICNKLYKTFSAINGVEIISTPEVEIIEEA